MKINCSQKDLNKALSLVNRAVNPNNTLPVLNNILIKSEKDGGLSLSATNLEIAIHTKISGTVHKEGSITVPSRVFENYVSLLSSGEVLLELLEKLTLQVKGGRSETKIKGITPEEFPLLPKIKDPITFEVPRKELKEALDQVVFSASVNISRPVLMGVFWSISSKGIRLAATDSYRLAERQLALELNIGDLNFVIPSKTAQELSRILSSAEEEKCLVSVSKNQILFTTGDVELISRLIEGNFPDYEQILPKTCKTEAIVRNDEFSLGIKQVSIIAKETTNNVKLRVSEKGIQILSDESQFGSGTSDVPAQVSGEAVEVSLNAQYLLDVLAHLEGENVYFGLNDSISPVMVKPEKGSGYLYIIMPLKT